MSFITAIGTATPVNKFSQGTIAEFMVKTMRLNDEDARKLRAIYRMTGIETRHSVLTDYGKTDGFDFFPNLSEGAAFPSTRERAELFRKHALSLSVDSVTNCLQGLTNFNSKSITHLIVVSCTGMYAPGLDIDLIHALQLNTNTERLCINFMGCYAAFNAIKQADYICNSQPHAKVLIVCTELCSIHFQNENTEDNLLANALFADGSAALLMQSSPSTGINLKPISFYADLAPKGSDDMAWTIGDLGFEMRLSSYVPDIIKQGIHQLTQRLLQQIDSELSDIDYFAIHPGGKKILETIETELALNPKQNQNAYNVLRRFGNMSSPTVLFVLQEILKQLKEDDNHKKILSVAFGPGLTLESMILEVIDHNHGN
jgi:prepilin-type processing-associated H-X9-DG protein